MASNNQKVEMLYIKLAGDKINEVSVTTSELMAAGWSPERAMADALEEHKCIKNKPAKNSRQDS